MFLAFVQNILDNYLNSGIKPSYSNEKKRQVKLTNFAYLVIITATIPFIYILKDEKVGLLIIFISLISDFFGFYLNKKHHHLVSKYFSTFIPTLFIYVVAPMVYLNNLTDGLPIKAMFLGHAAIPFLLFDKKEKIHLYVIISILIICILSFSWANEAITLQITQMDVDTHFNRNLLILNSLTIICSALFYFFNLNNRYNDELISQNAMLKQQHEEIIAQRDHLSILNDRLTVQNKQIENNDKLKTKVLSIIAHDLRAPFHTLKGVVSLLEKDISEPEIMKAVTFQLKTSIEHTYITLDNVLNWAIVEMDGHKTNKVAFDVYDEVENIINFYNEVTSEKQIQILNLLNVNTLVYADKDQVNLVIRNLLSNALKFTQKQGEIKLFANSIDDFWEIAVADNGVGMTEEQLSHIFESNTKKSTRGTNAEKGTGLGLVLCKDFVEENGGQIFIKSVLNEGTTFSFTVKKAY